MYREENNIIKTVKCIRCDVEMVY